MQTIQMDAAKQLVGQQIYAVKKDGTIATGKLVRIKGNRLYLKPERGKAQTKAFVPLVLFDLLAIGTSPFAGGFGFGSPFGFGFGSPFGFGGFGPVIW